MKPRRLRTGKSAGADIADCLRRRGYVTREDEITQIGREYVEAHQ